MGYLFILRSTKVRVMSLFDPYFLTNHVPCHIKGDVIWNNVLAILNNFPQAHYEYYLDEYRFSSSINIMAKILCLCFYTPAVSKLKLHSGYYICQVTVMDKNDISK